MPIGWKVIYPIPAGTQISASLPPTNDGDGDDGDDGSPHPLTDDGDDSDDGSPSPS